MWDSKLWALNLAGKDPPVPSGLLFCVEGIWEHVSVHWRQGNFQLWANCFTTCSPDSNTGIRITHIILHERRQFFVHQCNAFQLRWANSLSPTHAPAAVHIGAGRRRQHLVAWDNNSIDVHGTSDCLKKTKHVIKFLLNICKSFDWYLWQYFLLRSFFSLEWHDLGS